MRALLPDIDPEGLQAFSIVVTDRWLDHCRGGSSA
jgi:hypothetical protein